MEKMHVGVFVLRTGISPFTVWITRHHIILWLPNAVTNSYLCIPIANEICNWNMQKYNMYVNLMCTIELLFWLVLWQVILVSLPNTCVRTLFDISYPWNNKQNLCKFQFDQSSSRRKILEKSPIKRKKNNNKNPTKKPKQSTTNTNKK